MGVFNDFMNLVDLGERVAKGEGEKVKQELLDHIRADRAEPRGEPPEAPPACDKAPPGYKCLGVHDARGRCTNLEVLGPEPEAKPSS